MHDQWDAELARARAQRGHVLGTALRALLRQPDFAAHRRGFLVAGAMLGCVLLELRQWPAPGASPLLMRTTLAAALASSVILLLWMVAMRALHGSAAAPGPGRVARFAERGLDGGAGASMVEIGNAVRGESRAGGSGEEKPATT